MTNLFGEADVVRPHAVSTMDRARQVYQMLLTGEGKPITVEDIIQNMGGTKEAADQAIDYMVRHKPTQIRIIRQFNVRNARGGYEYSILKGGTSGLDQDRKA